MKTYKETTDNTTPDGKAEQAGDCAEGDKEVDEDSHKERPGGWEDGG